MRSRILNVGENGGHHGCFEDVVDGTEGVSVDFMDLLLVFLGVGALRVVAMVEFAE